MKTDSIALVMLVKELPQSDSPTVTMLSVFLALAIGEKVNEFMNTKIKYTNEPLGKVEVVADMLPSPEELAFKEDSVKVTISLSKSSVDFFKREAKKHDTKYQQMIRRLLDAYTRAQDRHITNH
jgi:predicted DNA binding CopG/RHH family protein